MLSYPLPEASELLSSKLSGAKQKMADCQEDIDFLREQITVRFHPLFPFHLCHFSNHISHFMEFIVVLKREKI